MNAKQRQPIARAVVARDPGVWVKGRLFALRPRGEILRGVFLDESSDPTKVYVWAFVQPLYMLTSSIVFTYGKRLGGPSKTWSVEDPEMVAAVIMQDGFPFVREVATPAAFVEWEYLAGRSDLHTIEAKACAYLLDGDWDQGARLLREVEQREVKDDRPWVVEMRRNARELADLATTDRTAALNVLAERVKTMISVLRLETLT